MEAVKPKRKHKKKEKEEVSRTTERGEAAEEVKG